MKSTPVVMVVLVVSLLVGGAVAWWMLGSASPTSSPASSDPARLAAMERRIAALEQEVKELREAQARPAPSREAPAVAAERRDPVGGGRPSSAHDEVAAWNAREQRQVDAILDVLDSEEPEVRERVSGLVRQELEEAREQEREQRRARMLERAEERTRELASTIGLEGEASERFVKTLVAEREQAMELFSRAREEGNFDEAREKVEQLRARTDTDMKQRLSPEQYQTYLAEREEGWGRGPGGGPGGGGWGGRGRGGRD